MQYQLAAMLHAAAIAVADRLRDQRGQGTVEYVGVVVVVTLLVAAIAGASAGWGDAVGGKIEDGIKKSITKLTGNLG